jgi:hypothetical protein
MSGRRTSTRWRKELRGEIVPETPRGVQPDRMPEWGDRPAVGHPVDGLTLMIVQRAAQPGIFERWITDRKQENGRFTGVRHVKREYPPRINEIRDDALGLTSNPRRKAWISIEAYQERAMRLPRVRFTVRRMMILIAFMALVSTLVVQSIRVASRDRELARLGRLLEDYQRVTDRLQWAERMYKKGYVSQAQLDVEKRSVRKVATSLGIHDEP